MRKRTLCNPNQPTEEIQSEQTRDTYNIDEEPIVISKSTIDLFLEQDKPGDVIALYQFYYYTAKWQKTNRPKCTTSYTATGLKWSEDRVRRTKTTLKELRLIEDLIAKDKAGKIKNHYIKVNFIWAREKIQTTENHHQGKPEYGKPLTMENPEGNALSSNNRNALSSNNRNALSYISVLNKWNSHKIIVHKKPTPQIESAIKQSLTYYSQEEIFKAIENYATVVTSRNHFFNYKWTLKDFLKRGLDKFVDEADPLNNFKNNGGPQTTKRPGRARSDDAPYPVDLVIGGK